MPCYSETRKKLLLTKREREEKLAAVNASGDSIFEPLKNFIVASKEAGILATAGKDEEKRDFFKKVASNRNVFHRELRWEPRGAWQLVIRQGSFAQQNAGETRDVDLKRGHDTTLECFGATC